MYGLTESLRDKALEKIRRHKIFLSSHALSFGSKQYRLSDFFKNSYINADRYIAEVNNRVASLYKYACERNLSNVFLTITLPSEYHPKKSIIKNGRLVKVIDNPRYINDEDHNPKNGSKELSRLFTRIQFLRAYRNIPKDDRVYFRVFEPHKDGTPHLHASIFIPADNVDSFVSSVKSWAKKNVLKKAQIKIEIDIKNPVAYLMKYILKTFDDLRKDKNNLSDLTLWYIVHGINRFYTSRTLVSLEIYRKFRGSHDLLQVTKMMRNNEISVLLDMDTRKPVMIYNNDYVIYSKKPFSKTLTNYVVEDSRIYLPDPEIAEQIRDLKEIPEYKNPESHMIPAQLNGIQGYINKFSMKFVSADKIRKSIKRMSILERENYRNYLYSELDNPFNELNELNEIEDRLIMLDRIEMELECETV